MGEVCLAQDSKLGRKVTLKLLPASFTKDKVAMEFFDFATRHERHVAGLGEVTILPFCIAVSPDRRPFLYTLNDQTAADIMLVENFS